MTHPLETEVKIPLSQPCGVREKLLSIGFQSIQSAQAEHSVLWDRHQELFSQGCALRLRTYGGATRLTWKGPKQEDTRFKIRPELETGVDNGEAMEQILASLGFAPTLRMEKRRELLERPGLVACLDETPFGAFLELEGTQEAILQALRELDMETAPVETRSYPALYQLHGLG